MKKLLTIVLFFASLAGFSQSEVCQGYDVAMACPNPNVVGTGFDKSAWIEITKDGVNVGGIPKGASCSGTQYFTLSSTGTYYVRHKVEYTTSHGGQNHTQVTTTSTTQYNVSGKPAAPGLANMSAVLECRGGSPAIELQWTGSNASEYYWQTSSGGQSTTYAHTKDISSNGTHFLRRRNSNGCWSDATSISVTNYPASLSAGSINIQNLACQGSVLNSTGGSSASGGLGSYSYQWQWSSLPTSSYTDIPGETAVQLSITTPATKKYYRRKVSDGCQVRYSGYEEVDVEPSVTDPGDLGSNISVCYNSGVVSLGGDPATGAPQIAYSWSFSGSGFTLNGPTNMASLSIRNVTANTTFTRTATTVPSSLTSCTNSVSTSVTVSVTALPATPTISVSYASDCSTATLTSSVATSYLWSNGATSRSITTAVGGSYWVKAVSSGGCESSQSSATSISFPTQGVLTGGTSGLYEVNATLEVTSHPTVKRWEYTQGASTTTVNSTSNVLPVSFTNSGNSTISRAYYAVLSGPGNCEFTTNTQTVSADPLGAPSMTVCVGQPTSGGLNWSSGSQGGCTLSSVDYLGPSGATIDGAAGEATFNSPGVYRLYRSCVEGQRVYGPVIEAVYAPTPPPISDFTITPLANCNALISYVGAGLISWDGNALEVPANGSYQVRSVIGDCQSSTATTIQVSVLPEASSVSGAVSSTGIFDRTLTLQNLIGTVVKWQYTVNGSDPIDIPETGTALDVYHENIFDSNLEYEYWAILEGSVSGCTVESTHALFTVFPSNLGDPQDPVACEGHSISVPCPDPNSIPVGNDRVARIEVKKEGVATPVFTKSSTESNCQPADFALNSPGSYEMRYYLTYFDDGVERTLSYELEGVTILEAASDIASDLSTSYSNNCTTATVQYTGSNENTVEWSDLATTPTQRTFLQSASLQVRLVKNNCPGPWHPLTISIPEVGTLTGTSTTGIVDVDAELTMQGHSESILRWEYQENGGPTQVVSSQDPILDNVTFSNSTSTDIVRTYWVVMAGPAGCEIVSNSVDVTAQAMGSPTVSVCIDDVESPGLTLGSTGCNFIRLEWVGGSVGGVPEGSSIKWTEAGIYQPITVHGPCSDGNGGTIEEVITYGPVVEVYERPAEITEAEMTYGYNASCTSLTITYHGSEPIIWSTGETASTISVTESGPVSVSATNGICNGPAFRLEVSVSELPTTTISKAPVAKGVVELSFPLEDLPEYGGWYWQEEATGEEAQLYRSTDSYRVFEAGTYHLRHQVGCGWSDPVSMTVTESDLSLNSDYRPRVTQYTPRIPGLQSVDLSILSDEEEAGTSIAYYDGLGRALQTVQKEQSPLGHDLVSPVVYDHSGRAALQYLPYVSTNASGSLNEGALDIENYASSDHYDYYKNNSPYEDAFAYSETVYEPSPLNRAVEQRSPGESWRSANAAMQYTYDVNGADEVLLWDYSTLLTSAKAMEPPTALKKNGVTDEDGNPTLEYVNKSGQTVLKKSQVSGTMWAETYYLYDASDQLRAVLPPEATAQLDSEFFPGDQSQRQQFLDRWAFQYDYDDRRRMVRKKVPGAAEVRMVYDQWDRLVLTQDGNQRQQSEWLFTSYDFLNRPVITGKIQDTQVGRQTQAGMQFYINGLQDHALTFVSGAANHQYDEGAYPFSQYQASADLTITEVLTVTYYDTYDFNGGPGYVDHAFATSPFHLDPALQDPVKGQVTGTKTKILGASGGPDNFLETITYYDNKYRVIQVVSDNHLGGSDVINTQYDFVGNVRRVYSTHSVGANTTTQLLEYDYDHANRLLSCDHTLNLGNPVRLYTNQYDELGQLAQKELHQPDGSSEYAQSIDYDYNIRGWLKSINESGLSGSTETPEPTDLFQMELIYNATFPTN